MLSEALKEVIRGAYAEVMARKSLSPRWGQRQMIAEIANALARIPEQEGFESPVPEDRTPADRAPEARTPEARTPEARTPADRTPEARTPAAATGEGGKLPICVVEAGTGTGKTIAYAVAAIPLARSRGKRLVVATATVALQEQFMLKDLPDIRAHSGLEFSYALAKGRRRYVCLSKLDRILAQEEGGSGFLPLYPEEPASPGAEAMPLYHSMLDSMARGEWDGDRDNWPDSVDDAAWIAVTTDHAQCSGRRCPNVGQCAFFRAREQLQGADIVVTNHDLALADLALGGGAILPAPEDSIYIFDEGHHLPDKALNHFASFCRLRATAQWLQESEKQLGAAARNLAPLAGLQGLLQALPGQLAEAARDIQSAEQAVAELFQEGEISERGDEQRLRLPHGLVPDALGHAAATLVVRFEALQRALARIEQLLEEALDDDYAEVDAGEIETWHLNFGGMLGRAEANLTLWRDFAADAAAERPPRARWINLLGEGGQFGFELRCSPILAADILRDCLWSRAAGVVVTSATITALNSFDRFRLHSGCPAEASYKVVPSPFDYARARLVVPPMDCDPGDAEAHTEAVAELLPRLLAEDEGSLVLFSSRRQMLGVHEALPGAWVERILLQGDYSKQEILRRHRAAIDAGSGSVIFGLASFAEGVDLPGDYCRHVVIAKIPFAVPDSPLEAALAEWVEAEGRNPFMEISVPDAALRLVQASGRLLRTEQDSGTVTLLDRRVLTRRYGQVILDSLPPFRRQLGRHPASGANPGPAR